jgi:hypothetical protein
LAGLYKKTGDLRNFEDPRLKLKGTQIYAPAAPRGSLRIIMAKNTLKSGELKSDVTCESSSYNQLAVEKSEGKQVTAYTCVLRIWDNGSVQAGGAVFLLEV